MPTLMAATQSRSTAEASTLGMRARASQSAMKAPVMAAVRVPPSAWITSQSSHTVRSPSLPRITTGRSASGARPSMRGALIGRARGARSSRAPLYLAQPLVPRALVLAEPGRDGAGDVVAIAGLAQLPLLLGVRDEPDLDEDRRHRGSAEHVEPGLLHAATRDAQRLCHRILHDLGQPRRFLL